MRKHVRGVSCPGSCVLLLFAYPSYGPQGICRFAAWVLLLFAKSFDFVNKVFIWGISVILWNYNTSCWKILSEIYFQRVFFFRKTVFIERTVHLQCRLFVKCRWILPVSNIIANFLKKYLYVFTWLHCVLAVACRICSSGMWDLVPWPGIKGPLHLGARSLSHWTTREVPIANILNTISGHENLLAVISVHLMSRVSWDLWVL